MKSRCAVLIGLLIAALPWQTALAEVSHASNQTLVYNGAITFADNEEVFALYDESAIKPTTLEITSLGGGINAGLQLGEWIAANKLDVRIPRYCVSACANYIFAAGQTKHLGDSSYLIWHGGAHQPGLAQNLKDNANRKLLETVHARRQATVRRQKFKEIDDYIEFVRRRETQFFRRLNINPNIAIFGQIDPYLSTLPVNAGYSGWDYSITDLQKLGVTNIEVGGNFWRPNSASNGIRVRRLFLE